MPSSSEFAPWMAFSLTSDGLIHSLSSVAEQWTGYQASEIVGRPVTMILADRSIFEVANMLRKASDDGTWEGELSHRTRSGHTEKTRASLMRLYDRENRSSGFLLLLMQHRQNGNGSVRPSVYEVASTLRETAHELNNPLAVMMGFAQLILLDLSHESRIRPDMERIHSEMKRVVHIVEKMHALAVSIQQDQPSLEQNCMTS